MWEVDKSVSKDHHCIKGLSFGTGKVSVTSMLKHASAILRTTDVKLHAIKCALAWRNNTKSMELSHDTHARNTHHKNESPSVCVVLPTDPDHSCLYSLQHGFECLSFCASMNCLETTSRFFSPEHHWDASSRHWSVQSGYCGPGEHRRHNIQSGELSNGQKSPQLATKKEREGRVKHIHRIWCWTRSDDSRAASFCARMGNHPLYRTEEQNTSNSLLVFGTLFLRTKDESVIKPVAVKEKRLIYIFLTRKEESGLFSCKGKNSSMELAVIWGNFSCSDLACSDLACSDMAHSDLAHTDLAHSDLAHSDLAHFFLSKFLLFSLNIHNLGTHLAHTQMEEIWPMELVYIVLQKYPHTNQKNCPVYIYKFSLKNDIFTQTLAPPKNHTNFFQKTKIECCLSNPIQYYISSIYFFHQIDLFVPSEIRGHFNIHTPFFQHLQIWPFWPQKPKNSNLTNSFLAHYSQHKMNQKSPKDPKSILILAMKLLYTYFWKMLPIGALIWLALIWLIWAQIAQPTSNHLKNILSGPSYKETSTLSSGHLKILCGVFSGQLDGRFES